MSTVRLRPGTGVIINHVRYSLLRKLAGDVWQMEDVLSKRVLEMPEIELRRQYACGTARLEAPETALVRAVDAQSAAQFSHLSEELLETARVRRQYVMAVLDLPSTQGRLHEPIEAVWKRLQSPATPPSPATVLRWKARYVAADRDFRALVDNSKHKGNRRPRFPERVKELVTQALYLTYLTRERKTLQDALDKAIVLVHSENRLLPGAMRLPLPTRRFVKRTVDSIPAVERDTARYGKVAATKRYRSVLRQSVSEAPLQRAEMDHCRLDILVIDDKTALPLGRPWVTVVIDVHTRCVLGTYLGFQPPSYLTVAYCLRNAMLPKDELKLKYPDLKHTWDAYGLMEELVVDNGMEFHSASLENVCFTMGVEIIYSPRKTPWFKGKIERFFRSLNSGIAHGNPGTTFSNILEKDDYDPAVHAVMRLSTLHTALFTWIVDYYHQRPHQALGMSPAEAWKSSIRPEEIRMPAHPEMLSAIMGRTDKRRLTHKGIVVDGVYYNSPDLTALRMQHGDTLDVDLRIDDSNIGTIYVLSPSGDEVYNVPAIARDYAQNLSRWQHQTIQRRARTLCPDRDGVPVWVEAKEEISQLVENDFKWAKGKSRTRVARHQEHSRGLGTVPVREPSDAPAEGSTSQLDVVEAARRLPAPVNRSRERLTTNIAPALPATARKRFAAERRDRTRQVNGQSYLEDKGDERT